MWIIQTPATVAWQKCGEVIFIHAVCSQMDSLLLGIKEFTNGNQSQVARKFVVWGMHITWRLPLRASKPCSGCFTGA